jgi:hypothetical protein
MHEFARRGDHDGRLVAGRKGSIDQRRLGVFQGVDAQLRSALFELRKRKHVQQFFEMAEHVGAGESANPAGKIQPVRHLSSPVAAKKSYAFA